MDDQQRKPVIRFSGETRVGLVLPGGGARGAYQVGVLKAIAELLPRRSPSPFSIVSGTSAGAVNTVVIASRARLFHVGVAELEHVWRNFKSAEVFKSDAGTMFKNGLHWLLAVVTGGLGGQNPLALLDNSPLRELLRRRVNFGTIQKSIDAGYVDAVSITCAGYSSSRSVSFYQGNRAARSWSRVRRVGREAELDLDHVMASIAVPIVFPPVLIGHEYFGDGAMRQATPLSPAVHLGADRILVIGVRNEEPDAPLVDDPTYPSLGRVAGYMLDALFMDGLSADLERLARINSMLSQLPEAELQGDEGPLRAIDAFVMLPSEDVREIAERHIHEVPGPVRILLKGLGAMNKGGMQLASYLLFESGYTRELIDLGYKDAMGRKEELLKFLAGEPMGQPSGITGWNDLSNEYTSHNRILKTSGEEESSEP